MKTLKDLFKSKKQAPARSKESLSFNSTDDYIDADLNFDMANGCLIVADAVVDVGLAADVVVDVAAAAGAEGAGAAAAGAGAATEAGGAAADATADAVADAGADAGADGAGDGAADSSANSVDSSANSVDSAQGGVQQTTVSRWASLKSMLQQSMIDNAILNAGQALEKVVSGGGGSGSSGTPAAPATVSTYWTALGTQLSQQAGYTCDNNANTPCGANVRAFQEAMLIAFQSNVSTASTSDAASATSIQNPGTIWTDTTLGQIKSGLVNVSSTAGIPSMINYMATFNAYPVGISAGALTIAGANIIIEVADMVYSNG